MPDSLQLAPDASPSSYLRNPRRLQGRIGEYLSAVRRYYLIDGSMQPEGRLVASVLWHPAAVLPVLSVAAGIATERASHASIDVDMPAPEYFDEAIEQACQLADVADTEAARPHLRGVLQRAIIHALACDLDARGEIHQARRMRALSVETSAAGPTRDRIDSAL